MKFVRKTPAGTNVYIGRKDSQGLAGTIANMNHHAKSVQAQVDLLSAAVEHIPFKDWTQAHNVHRLASTDGRTYSFRPLSSSGSYIGIELSQMLTGGKKVVLMQIIEPSDLTTAIGFLQHLARPHVRNEHQPAKSEVAIA